MGRTCCAHKLFFVFVLTFRTMYVHNMFSLCSELGIFLYWTCNSMNNLLSYCGLIDPQISASKKDLSVLTNPQGPGMLTNTNIARTSDQTKKQQTNNLEVCNEYGLYQTPAAWCCHRIVATGRGCFWGSIDNTATPSTIASLASFGLWRPRGIIIFTWIFCISLWFTVYGYEFFFTFLCSGIHSWSRWIMHVFFWIFRKPGFLVFKWCKLLSAHLFLQLLILW